jgi:TolB-like protein/Flp pilus assembly protein TadD
MSGLLTRLKERKMVQWGLAYLAAGWFALELVGFLAESFFWPSFVTRAAAILYGLGFLAALVLAWYHGEKGRQRVSGPELVLLTLVAVAAGISVRVFAPGGDTARPPEPEAPRFASTTEGVTRLAILPLSDLSAAEAERDYLADGLHQEIMTQVSKIAALEVVSRTSVLRFRDPGTLGLPAVADSLNSRYLVEGSMRRVGDRVRITVSLSDALEDRMMWTDDYDREVTAEALFDIQATIALSIAQALSSVLAPAEVSRIQRRYTDDDLAYELYLQGKRTWAGGAASTTPAARALFRQAVAQDSLFAPAWAALAFTEASMGNYALEPADEVFPRAVEAANRALALDEAMLEAHVALAWTAFNYERDWQEVIDRLDAVIELFPGSPEPLYLRAYALQALGRFDEAVATADRMIALDPMGGGVLRAAARMYHIDRQFERAIEILRRSLLYSPEATGAHTYIALSLEQLGRTVEAVPELQQGARGVGFPTDQVSAWPEIYAQRGWEAVWEAWLGLALAADAPRPANVAIPLARLGRADEAVDWLERGVDSHESWLFQLNDPLWDPIRTHPRFIALLERLGLPVV